MTKLLAYLTKDFKLSAQKLSKIAASVFLIALITSTKHTHTTVGAIAFAKEERRFYIVNSKIKIKKGVLLLYKESHNAKVIEKRKKQKGN